MKLEQIVKDEIVQRKEEGYDIEEIEKRFIEMKEKSVYELKEILEALEKSTIKHDYPYKEPSNLEEIRAERPKKLEKFEVSFSEAEFLIKFMADGSEDALGVFSEKLLKV